MAFKRMFLILVLSMFTVLQTGTAVADEPDCAIHVRAMMRAYAPPAWALYERDRQLHRDQFFGFIDCGERGFGIPDAIHEAVHRIDATTRMYVLLDGGSIPTPKKIIASPGAPVADYFAPKAMGSFIDRDLSQRSARLSGYVLGRDLGSSASVSRFTVLLDELNAYSHGLAVASRLSKDIPLVADYRDGVLELMYFVKVYVHAAKTSYRWTWRALQQDAPMKSLIRALWRDAETALLHSCPYKDLGMMSDFLAKKVLDDHDSAAITDILGRYPKLPTCSNK